MYLYIHSPATVFAAQVNQTVFSYPLMQIAFDGVTTGAYTDIKEGMTVMIGTSAGLDNLGRVRVRKSAAGTVASSTVLNVSRSSRGTGDGELNLANDVYITVLDQYLVWGVHPYITDTGVIYKDGEIPFNINYAHRPKANIGGDVLKIVDVGVTEADIYFDGQYSYVSHPDAVASGVVTYAWSFPGCTPSTSSDATPGMVEVPLGKRHVSLTVTDSNGVTHTSRALVVVTNEDDPDLIKYWSVDSWTEGQQGQEIRIRVDQPLSYATYPDSTDVLICTSEHEDQVGLAGREHMLFSGWLSEETSRVDASERGLINRLSFGLADVATRLRELPSFPDTVDRKSTPTNWMEMEGANPDRFVHYRLDWHTTALTRADFYPSGYADNYAFTTLSSSGSNMFEDITWITGATAHLITCDIYGALWMMQDPQITPTAAQNAALSVGIERDTTSRLTLEPRQWSGYGYTHQRTPRTHFNWGEALLTSTANMSNNLTIYTAHVVAPGFSPGQGAGEDNTTQQIVKNVNELRMRVGNIYRARQNALKSNFQIDLIPMRAAIHPANMEWITMSLTSGQAGYRGRTMTNQRVLPITIEYDVDVSRGIRKPRLSVELEVTDGTPATAYTPKSDQPSDWSFNIPDIDFGEFVYPIPEWTWTDFPSYATPVKFVAAEITAEGSIARATAWVQATGECNWEDVGNNLTGIISCVRGDPYNYGWRWVTTTTGLWKCENFWTPTAADVTWTLVASNLSMFGNADYVAHHFLMSINRRGYIFCRSGSRGYAVSFNYGASWTTGLITSADTNGTYGTWVYDANWGNADIDQYNNGVLYAGYARWNSAVGGYQARARGIAKSTDWGVTWFTVLDQSFGYNQKRAITVNVPYMRVGGVPNTHADGQQLVYATAGTTSGDNHDTFFRSVNGGGSWSGIYGANYGNSAPALFGIHSYTLDASFMTRIWTQSGTARMHFTQDEWSSFAGMFALGGGRGALLGMNGWPTNPYIMLYFGSIGLRFCYLDTATSVDLLALHWPYATNKTVIYADMDLSDYIPPA